MTTPPAAMQFTPELAKQLKESYDTAVADGHEQFDFHGHALHTEYAKFLVEYLYHRFGVEQ